jgi:ABC-type multidrug transport system fused ATPase/permease subunit
MNIHKIDAHLHQSFLEEERKDAITGDLIQTNDEVVFCGICKSAFLKYSWEYMDRKHCGQSKTLKAVPISKPLLLNITIVKPTFITLTNSSTSFEDLLKNISPFKPKDKKVEIRLDLTLKKGTKQHDILVEKMNRRAEKSRSTIETTDYNKPTPKVKEVEPNEDRAAIIFLSIILCLGISIPLYLVIDDFGVKIALIVIVILPFYLFFRIFYFLKRKLKRNIKREKIISLENLQGNSTLKNLITFGVFNHNLFFYFEELQQAVFIELARIDEIEIKYTLDCYIFLILKRYEVTSKDIKVPLIFSKNVRITKFLIKLAEAKKDISNPLKIVVTNFPINQKNSLKKSLKFYPAITFIENEYT